MLNGAMNWYDPRPGRASSIAPGKRRFSSMAPSMVFEGDKPVMTLGAPGGAWIGVAILQVLLNVLDWGLSMQEAVSAPRFSATSDAIDIGNASRGGRKPGSKPWAAKYAVQPHLPFAARTASPAGTARLTAAPTRSGTGMWRGSPSRARNRAARRITSGLSAMDAANALPGNPAAPSARLRRLVDQRAPPQLVERQRRVDPARVIEIAVEQTVEEMANVEPAGPAGGIRVAHDVDRAAVGQQVIELRLIGQLVDPLRDKPRNSRRASSADALRR